MTLMTHTFESLARSGFPALEHLLTTRAAPSFESIAGFEFRGWNVLAPMSKPVASIMGIQRFAKGFFLRPGVAAAGAPFIEGYNIKISRGGLSDAWAAKGGGALERFGFYRVHAPGAGDRLGRYAQALFLDYREGDPRNSIFTGDGLRDFVVSITPDLLLGKAYFALGPVTVVGGFFVAERWHEADFVPPLAARVG
jgi:hypothetical protein